MTQNSFSGLITLVILLATSSSKALISVPTYTVLLGIDLTLFFQALDVYSSDVPTTPLAYAYVFSASK